MSVNPNDGKNIPTDADAYYEAVASQEEVYLEEVEEELRAILIFGDATRSRSEEKRLPSDANNDPCVVESSQKQLTDAAEELITGDSDDAPLSEEAVTEMLRMSQITKGFRLDM